jgi:hypothetical protein
MKFKTKLATGASYDLPMVGTLLIRILLVISLKTVSISISLAFVLYVIPLNIY